MVSLEKLEISSIYVQNGSSLELHSLSLKKSVSESGAL